jgi:adenylate cyclase
MTNNLFEEEEAVIKRSQVLLNTRPDEKTLLEAFSQLLNNYQKLFRQFARLLRMNDRQQAELSKKTKELNVRNQFIQKIFGRYVSDEVVEKILESPGRLNLKGKTLRVTVMFTDLRGFSAISESLPPQSVVEMLNIYLHEMTDIVFKYAGTINEFTGDGLLVLFGAPSVRHSDADRALACALEMQLAMKKVNVLNQERGFPELEMGIGINTGKVVAGNIGSDIRTKYAVVGRNVNLASRVESFTVGGQILITQATLDAVSVEVKIAGEFTAPFKGIREPVTMHDISGIAGEYNLFLPVANLTYRMLNQPLPVKYEIITGKTSSDNFQPGEILGFSEKQAILTTSAPLEIHTNLKLLLISHSESESAIYGKIKAQREDGSYEINFTSVPKEILSLIEQLNQ